MACFDTLQGFPERLSNGKRKLLFAQTEYGARVALRRSKGEVIDLPCGKCEGCRLERAQQLALRCQMEASLWPSNLFVTLTYSPDCLPVVGGVPTLRPRDFQLFMKRLRKDSVSAVRFVQAGEYGRLGRPHHHALLFNCSFPDLEFLRWTSARAKLWRSKTLERLWPLGYSSLGEVTFESAAYVARYTLKKLAGPCVELVGRREPEYMTMSLKPGIGAGWFEKFKGDVFPHDEVVSKGGRRFRPPRYFSTLFEREDPEGFARVKAKRVSLPDPDSYAVFVAGKLHTRTMARRELAVLKVKEYLERKGDL